MKRNWLVLLCLVLVMIIFPKSVFAAYKHGGELINDYTDSDGLHVYVRHLYVDISGSTTINNIKGKLKLVNQRVVSFEFNSGFDKTNFDNSTLIYELISNKPFKAGRLVYATVTTKQLVADENCDFGFEPIDTNRVNTNKFNITKEVFKDGVKVSEVRPGEIFEYLITVTSDANVLETDEVTVTDDIPSELEIVNTYEGTSSGNKVTWNLGKFQPGTKTVTLKVDVRAKTDVTGNINNVAVLKVGDEVYQDDEPIKVGDSKITITKAASRNKIKAGMDFYYTIVVKNIGTLTSKSVIVEDNIDSSYLSVLSTNPVGTYAGDNYKFNLGTLNPGASKTIRINVKANDVLNVDKILNTAIAKEEDKDPVQDDVEVIVEKEVIDPDIKISKKVSKNEVKRGEEFIYTITVVNGNELKLSDVVVTDKFDDNLEIVDAGDGTISNNLVTWSLNLDSNESKDITVKVKVKTESTIKEVINSAKVTHEGKDIPSNEVKVKIKDEIIEDPKKPDKPPVDPDYPDDPTVPVKNPQTGNTASIIVIIVGSITSILILWHAKIKKKLYHI